MELDQNQKLTIIGLFIAITIGSGYYFYNHFLKPSPPKIIEKSEKIEIFVQISGAVRHEGVYRLKSNARLCELINLAGGLCQGAEISSLNLSEVVKDSQKIIIPLKITIPQEHSDTATKTPKINLNTSTASQLDELDGVGPSTAKKIIEARPFAKPEDLLKIPRFGKSKYEKIKNKICI